MGAVACESHQRKSRMVAAAKLADIPMSESLIGVDCPVGHRSHIQRWEGRLTHRKPGSKSLVMEASNSAGRSASEPVGSPEKALCRKVSSPSTMGEDQRRRRRNWVNAADGLPGVSEDDMLRRNGQRKLGSTRGSPRRTRTAKALRISRSSAKSRCACEWGGWGRLSDDGPGQNNPDRSEGPWGRATMVARAAVYHRVHLPGIDRIDVVGRGVHEGWMQTGW